MRYSRLEVSLGALKSNALAFKGLLYEGQEIIAVVKADGYGHGGAAVARALEEVGVRHFAVASLKEAVTLRKGGVSGSILILSYTPVELMGEVAEYDLMQTVYSAEYAEAVAATGTRAKVQLAVDTGMRRIGFDGKNCEACIKEIRKYSSLLNTVGLFTHLAAADCKDKDYFTVGQLEKFDEISEGVGGEKIEFVHCLNSAGGIWHNNKKYKFVRVGIPLYGLNPSSERRLPIRLKPIQRWISTVSALKTVKKGDYVGYGLAYRAKKATRVATVTTGYADGYSRALSGRGRVFFGGRQAVVVGRICMDQMMVDASELADLRPFDEVTLLDERYTADDMARELGTVGYEIVCAIGSRVERIYTE